jgi:UDP-glucose 4-epimerase
VTGGLGFIGGHLVDYFLNNGDEVALVDNASSNVLSPEYYNSRARLEKFIGDIADESIVGKIFNGRIYDYIFHFAANASVPRSVEDEDLNFRSNVTGTHNIMRQAVKHRSSVILASTSTVYGEYNGKAVDEQSPVRPISPYGLTKLIDESFCFHYGRIHETKVVALRLFNVYGPRQRRCVMSDFLEKLIEAKDKEDIVMLGTGNEIRDFINIKDVINAIILPLKRDNMWGEVFNIGSGKRIKIKQILFMMLEELGLKYALSFSGKSWQGDVFGIYADNRKIRSFGFEPIIDMRTGMKEFIRTEQECGYLSTNESMGRSQGALL